MRRVDKIDFSDHVLCVFWCQWCKPMISRENIEYVRCVLDIVLFDCSYLPSRFNEYAESKAKNEKFSTQQTNNWNNKIQTQFWNTQKFDFVSFHKQQIATKF